MYFIKCNINNFELKSADIILNNSHNLEANNLLKTTTVVLYLHLFITDSAYAHE